MTLYTFQQKGAPSSCDPVSPGPGYEHVDPGLVALVAGPGLDAVELRGDGARVVHQTQPPGHGAQISL